MVNAVVADGELAEDSVVDGAGVEVSAVDGMLVEEEGSEATEEDMDKEVVAMGKGMEGTVVVEDIKKKVFFCILFL